MQKDRRYNEKEIAAIFEQAASDHKKAKREGSAGAGLTLRELEQIGKESGIDPDFIARAAARLDSNYQVPAEKKLAWMPIQVNRNIQLPGTFSDADWDRLVVDLHDTFQATGTSQSQPGSRIRSWSNGRVQVHVEPAGDGYRLRIKSENDMDVIFLTFGAIFFLMSLMFMGIAMTKGKFMTEMDDTLIFFILSAIGLVSGGLGAFRLPIWHKSDADKIDGIVDRVLHHSSRGSSTHPVEDVKEEHADHIKDAGGQSRIGIDDALDSGQVEQATVRQRSKAK